MKFGRTALKIRVRGCRPERLIFSCARWLGVRQSEKVSPAASGFGLLYIKNSSGKALPGGPRGAQRLGLAWLGLLQKFFSALRAEGPVGLTWLGLA